MSDNFEFRINQQNSKPMGGTELVFERVMNSIDDKLKEEFIIIPQRVREEHINDSRKKILWLHDLAEDPESEHLKYEENRKRFEKFVFPTSWALWEFHQKLGVPLEDSIVIPNCIEPIPIHDKPKDGKTRIIYFSTPHRGLNILESVARVLQDARNDFEIDVYSSFKLYGRDQQDDHPEFQELYGRLNELKCVNYYGTVSNDEIRKALTKTHILAYPSTYLETSCLVAIEAMAAGCYAVVPNWGALPETCASFANMYAYHPDPAQHAAIHYHYLCSALNNFWNDNVQSILEMQRSYYNYYYSMDMCSYKWNGLLRSLSR